jgi:hypothetical protein
MSKKHMKSVSMEDTEKVPSEASGEEPATAADVLPRIEPSEAIRVADGGKLVVPREDLLADLDDGAEMDLLSAQAKKIRRPDRREWVVINPASQFPLRCRGHSIKT